ncbi:MAG: ABC transporter ATP-binding protein [Halodesulfurarchaeum sp.]
MSVDVDVRATFHDAETTFEVDVDLSVESGETLVVLGPSGSGKTLMLETVAGFHQHEGRVHIDGRDVTDLKPEKRGLGLVFQDYALFPHMTARENVSFGTRYHEQVRDVEALLAALDIAHLADRTPRTLSGGEKQRVSLARALAIDPVAFLLDEPLSSLDAPTRDGLRRDLVDLLADETALYVTHDRTTARSLADRIAVMSAGQIQQVGTPEAVFEKPATRFVAEFTGANVFTDGVLERTGTPDSPFAIRPEHVEVNGDVDRPAPDLEATVDRVIREDAAYRVALETDGVRFDAFTHSRPTAESVGVRLPPERCHTFEENSG